MIEKVRLDAETRDLIIEALRCLLDQVSDGATVLCALSRGEHLRDAGGFLAASPGPGYTFHLEVNGGAKQTCEPGLEDFLTP